MEIDQARRDVESIHIDRLECVLWIEMFGDCSDLSVFYSDVAHGVDVVFVIEDVAALEQQIVWQRIRR